MHSPSIETPGSIDAWKKEKSGISGTAGTVAFFITFYTPGTVRVRYNRNKSSREFSYAVVSTPGQVSFRVEETEQFLECRTDMLVVRVLRSPLRIVFLTPGGSVISEDDPAFGTTWIGEQVTTYKKLQEKERFIGLGEKTGPLDRRGRGYQNWNTDTFAYSPGSDPLYSTLPFYIGIHHQVVYGIFFDNTHKTFFNFGASNNRFASFAADAGDMDYYFFHGPDVASLLSAYAILTGHMPLPPRWSLGYQQCRYSYYPDTEVTTLARTFRDKQLPADAIVLDIHYMDKYKIFTWDKNRFPDPKGMIKELKRDGFHVVVMCDPGIKVEKGYKAYDDGLANDVFIKYPDGTDYTGEVWPGWCHFPDFTNVSTRAWWGRHLKTYTDIGIDGFWNDMNEISTWGNLLPENIVLDFDGSKVPMRTARNVYGLQMARSTYEGAKKLLSGKRPFNLTRSGYAGIQRYAALWTGDNVSYDEHMLLGVRMVSSLGLAGVAFAGYDVGGFVGEADTKLFARWFSIGALSPFFRGHTMINSRDAEPWTFGEEVEQICRNYLNLRYRLLPYLYSLFHEATQTGMPVQRSLAIGSPFSRLTYMYPNQYLLGPYLLIAAVESSKEFAKVFLPEGTWYHIYSGKPYEGDSEVVVEAPLTRLPVFVREGAILPMSRVIQHTGQTVDLLELHIYRASQATSLLFYTDDGETFDYQGGDFHQRNIENSPDGIIIHAAEGSYKSPYKNARLVLHGFDLLNGITINGKATALLPELERFMEPMEKFDPVVDPEPPVVEKVQTAAFVLTGKRIEISW